MSGYVVERVGPERPIPPQISLALRIARNTLQYAGQTCRYHGTDFDRSSDGPGGMPRCESCRQPWRVTQALAALDRVLGTGDAAS